MADPQVGGYEFDVVLFDLILKKIVNYDKW